MEEEVLAPDIRKMNNRFLGLPGYTEKPVALTQAELLLT